jgi:hypothetical protein
MQRASENLVGRNCLELDAGSRSRLRQTLEEAASRSDAPADAFRLLARVYRCEIGHVAETCRVLLEGLERHPDDRALRVEAAVWFADGQGQYARALPIIESLQPAPEPEIRWLECQIAYRGGDHAGALAACRALLSRADIEPEAEVNLRFRLADILRLSGQVEQARDELALLCSSPALRACIDPSARVAVNLALATAVWDGGWQQGAVDAARAAARIAFSLPFLETPHLPTFRLGSHLFGEVLKRPLDGLERLRAQLEQQADDSIFLGRLTALAVLLGPRMKEGEAVQALERAATLSGDAQIWEYLDDAYVIDDPVLELKVRLRHIAGNPTGKTPEVLFDECEVPGPGEIEHLSGDEVRQACEWLSCEFLPSLRMGPAEIELVHRLYRAGWVDLMQRRGDHDLVHWFFSSMYDLGCELDARAWAQSALSAAAPAGELAFRSAEESLREAQRLGPDDVEVWIASATFLLVGREDEPNGRETLMRAAELDPEHPRLPWLWERLERLVAPEKVVRQAQALVRAGECDAALQLVRDRAIKTPAGVRVAVHALAALGRWEEAFDAAAEGVHRDGSGEACWLYAELCLEAPGGKFSDALTYGWWAVEDRDCPVEAYQWVGLHGFDEQHDEAAEREPLLRKGLKAHPYDQNLTLQLAGLLRYERRDVEGALELLSQTIAATPPEKVWASLRWEAMLCHIEQREYGSALDALAQVEVAEDSRSQRDLVEAALWALQGDLGRAEALCLPHLDDEREMLSAAAHLTHAFAAVRAGRPDHAVGALGALFSLPGNKPASAPRSVFGPVGPTAADGSALRGWAPEMMGEVCDGILRSDGIDSLLPTTVARLKYALAQFGSAADGQELRSRAERAQLLREAMEVLEIPDAELCLLHSAGQHGLEKNAYLCLKHGLRSDIAEAETFDGADFGLSWADWVCVGGAAGVDWIAREDLTEIPASERARLHLLAVQTFQETPHRTGAVRMSHTFHRLVWSPLLLRDDLQMWDELEEAARCTLGLMESSSSAERDLVLCQVRRGRRTDALAWLSVLRDNPTALPADIERAESAVVLAFGASAVASDPERPEDPLQAAGPNGATTPSAPSRKEVRKAASRKRTSALEDAPARPIEEDVLARYLSLDFFKQGLLRTIHFHGGAFRSLEHLAELACQDVLYLDGHLRKLREAGIVRSTGTMQFELETAFAEIVERESRTRVSVKVVGTDASSEGRFKSVFNSKAERRIYQIVQEIFPNHMTYPNMALRTVFPPERIKERLSRDAFDFLWKGSVDLMVVSSSTDLPIGGIEVDSIYHDTERQQRRDALKNEIFAVAGVPLFRLRSHGNPELQAVRGELVEQISRVYDSPDAVHEAFRRLLQADG